ncbi:histidine kinase [Streptomyces agglomeratus]|uniref:histidine kinase n=1 Tax=Streptomyces agglomeratus TaxID=285458 RepID=A0A1E5PDM4_9ACTN|nr:histidine kinase [Streptomyces agglomeratus]OEJ27484.1 histidine kinase [Streptomyces agglomeratus]OEJ38459.1 histidine kinase [Streptomyces agglomeratus]OEJ47156.1 histidine kinase [Streptomyces agglomeratus]OEJ50987.1 histidine kinase [Streptomyces agglomeratus]OEJ58357.1 histidine kinase [Streptomyces agglomeratus]
MRRLFGARARLRWIHLILGGALSMPYFLLGSVLVGPFIGNRNVFTSASLQFAAFGVALPIAALTAFFPLVRPLSVGAVRALCGVPRGQLADGPARSGQARMRTAGWYTLHLGVGGIISGMTLAVPPFAGTLVILPLFTSLRGVPLGLPEVLNHAWALALAPLAGIAMLVALAACAALAGELLARCAPVLLGPTPADRLAAAERRAADLAVRNRLARELHDSVGHALSAVTLQAGAARRVLDSDVEFVREALTAIEETTRRTVGELDAVLGLLRQGEDAHGDLPGPTLDVLDDLLARSGVKVAYVQDGDPAARAPEPVSREAYRIVQEGLSNALRHGGAAPVSLRIALCGEELEIVMENPLSVRAPVVRPGGGRGLPGIAERATLLGGHAEAGAQGDVWRLTARLPVGNAGGER